MVKKVIVIGASAGGLKALTQLVANVPPDLPVAIFTVLHLSKTSSAINLANHLEKHTTYKCRIPEDNEEIKAGHLYLAPANYHMFLKPDTIRLLHGAKENRWRPSIDVLFRSAAAAYDSRVTGIILSGMLDDGTSGMSAIKRSGGICIVQEPSEAEFTSMPENVINNVEVDYRVLVTDIGYILADIVSKPSEHQQIPDDVKTEASITERMISSIPEMQKLGVHSNYACHDCGGNLWEIVNDPAKRYRCHTGHVYNEVLLANLQIEKIEESVWVSIRMMEERRNLLVSMSLNKEIGESVRERFDERARQLVEYIDTLKSMLITIGKKDSEA